VSFEDTYLGWQTAVERAADGVRVYEIDFYGWVA